MVQQLTKKLETLWQKFKMKKQEIDEVVQENQREKLELHDTVRDLTKELRLKVAARFRCSTQVSWCYVSLGSTVTRLLTQQAA